MPPELGWRSNAAVIWHEGASALSVYALSKRGLSDPEVVRELHVQVSLNLLWPWAMPEMPTAVSCNKDGELVHDLIHLAMWF